MHGTERGLTTGARLWWWRQWAGAAAPVELGSAAMGVRATNTRAAAGTGGSGEQGTSRARLEGNEMKMYAPPPPPPPLFL